MAFVMKQARIHPDKIIQLPIVHSTCVHTFAKNICTPKKELQINKYNYITEYIAWCDNE